MILRTGPLQSVVSNRCLVAEAKPEDGILDDLYPCERVVIDRAVPSRQREYAAGRRLARILLARLGRPEVALPAGPDRLPLWPDGFVGSITHCSTHVAVAIAEDTVLRSIGCDVEPAVALPAEVVDRVLTATERDALRGHEPWSDRLVFCAKEAAYKAQFPLARQFLDFQEVEVDLDWSRGRFRATVSGPHLLSGTEPVLDGRFTVMDGLIATAVEITT